ncbi:hypothetical protein G6514_004673 [Epicoccum nigrum]|nr:hypothetical protein G6514_004673 [Epicoccum nigrum]
MDKDSASKGAPVAQCNIFDYLTSPSIRVSVGKLDTCMQNFTMHQDLISTRSEFFAKALRGDWKEAQERTVVLPDDEPEVFRLYLQFLYTGQVALNSVARGGAYVVLSKLYVLAEKLIDETAKTALLAALSKRDGKHDSQGVLHCPGFESINIIYNGTPDDSAARECVVDLYTKSAVKSLVLDLFSSTQRLPHDFLSDLIKSVVNFWPLPQKLEHAERKIKCL